MNKMRGINTVPVDEVDLVKLNPILHKAKDKFVTDLKIVKYKIYD